MSGASGRPLFTNAPVMPAAQTLPTMPAGSNLAAALMQPHPFSLSPPSFGGVPLGSMMQMMQNKGGGMTSANSGDPNLVWNPNNPVGTESLGGNTANQGSMLANAAATYLPGYQGAPAPAPAASPSGMYQPTADDASLMAAMRATGALAPQYQQPTQGLAPGMPQAGMVGMPTPGMPGGPVMGGPGTAGVGAPGTSSPGQPGAFGQAASWLSNLFSPNAQ